MGSSSRRYGDRGCRRGRFAGEVKIAAGYAVQEPNIAEREMVREFPGAARNRMRLVIALVIGNVANHALRGRKFLLDAAQQHVAVSSGEFGSERRLYCGRHKDLLDRFPSDGRVERGK